jgi:hypothetical protein
MISRTEATSLLLFYVHEYVVVSGLHRARGIRYRIYGIGLKHYPDALRY